MNLEDAYQMLQATNFQLHNTKLQPRILKEP